MKVGIETSIATAIALGTTAGGGLCEFPDCFPDATNTGVPAGTSLTAYTGPNPVTADDTVIDSKIITGSLVIDANNVIVRNSQITGSIYMVFVSSGSVTLEDCDITCGNVDGTGLGSHGMTVTRCDVCCCENGFNIDGPMTIQDSYIHDLYVAVGTHTDGIQFNQEAHDVNVLHNTILATGANSAIIMWDGADPQNSNVLIEHNRLVGGGYTIYTPRTGPLTNCKVINNRLGMGVTGYNGGIGSLLTDASGNIDDITGLPVAIS